MTIKDKPNFTDNMPDIELEPDPSETNQSAPVVWPSVARIDDVIPRTEDDPLYRAAQYHQKKQVKQS